MIRIFLRALKRSSLQKESFMRSTPSQTFLFDAPAKQAGVLVPCKYFSPSLTFLIKAGAHQAHGPNGQRVAKLI
jgi:hypothetical protein